MKNKPTNYKNIYYPPGGILIWILIFLELLTFGIAMISMVVESKEQVELFHHGRMQLNAVYGTINTVILLTSGYFMAVSVRLLKQNTRARAKKYLGLTIIMGLLFLIVKGVEYNEKIRLGLNINYDVFFTYYWMLTLFHVIHVLVGLVILLVMYINFSKEDVTFLEDYEASGAFWHMCDLIWLLLFPILYLIL